MKTRTKQGAKPKVRSYYIPKLAKPLQASKAILQALSVFSDRLHEYAQTEQGQRAALASWDFY